MNTCETYLQSIHTAYPDFPVASVSFNNDGQNNDVLIVNNQYIFRFPKFPGAKDRLKTETAVLSGIQEFITLDIPNPAFIRLNRENDKQTFVGYRMIPGKPFWRETFMAIGDDETLDSLAGQLATFLKEMHNVPVNEAIPCELPVSCTYEECIDIYTRIREKLFSYMRPDACEWTVNHFEAFLSNASHFEYTPVLRHGDLGPGNILFDEQTQTLTGIIDFGSAKLGDPAYDFAGLVSGYGEKFIRRCCKFYPEIETFWTRIRFYKGTFALLEALFGIEHSDKEAFESGIQDSI